MPDGGHFAIAIHAQAVGCACRTRQAQADPQATFAPTLNERSRRLALARKARALQGSPACSASPRAGAAAPACTFTPSVNATTSNHLSRAGIPASFEARQQYYSQRRDVRLLSSLLPTLL